MIILDASFFQRDCREVGAGACGEAVDTSFSVRGERNAAHLRDQKRTAARTIRPAMPIEAGQNERSCFTNALEPFIFISVTACIGS